MQADPREAVAHHASPPSSVSGFVRISIHCANKTFPIFLPLGTGRERYMKVLYVVDV